jgi:crotonobetainyl-CoA:carnitine CoA-transferase CaiB-like acyl-CoA transferase
VGPPLEGIKVLDLSQMWAVPGAAMYLADQGAEVIKVEPPRGDAARQTYAAAPLAGGLSRSFIVLNRNKRGIVVDITREQGKEIIYRLVERSDVMLENFRPGVADRLGLGYETVQRINPRIIYVSVTPYGSKGPYAHRPAYDLITQALSGIMGHRSLPDGTPLGSGVFVADCSAPMLIGYGVALALLVREKTGRGQKIETSLLNLAIAMQSVDLVRVEQEPSSPRAYAAQAVYAPYRCQDNRYLVIVVLTDEQWSRLCKALDLSHLIAHPRFSTPLLRAEHSAELFPVLQAVFLTRPRDQWLELLEKEDVPCAPIITAEEVFRHPQILANEMIVEFDHPTVGRVKMMGIPIKLTQNPGEIRLPAPALGQHTEEVLRELGYSDPDIEALRGDGIIG